MMGGVPKRMSRDRAALITIGSGMTLLLVLGVIFSAAWGSQRITGAATALHSADETMRAATTLRAQVALALHMAAVDREFGTNSLEARRVSISEAGQALDETVAGLSELTTYDQLIIPEDLVGIGYEYTRLADDVLATLEEGDSVAAQLVAEESLDDAFGSTLDLLVAVRNSLFDEVTYSDGVLSTVGDVSRFLVAFLIPATIILIYQRIASRARRQSELEARLEAERKLSRAREEFIANASHELRTPLTGIHGLAMMLEEDTAVQSSEVASEFVDLIISESTDLSRMVEDLLTTARLDAGALTYSFSDVDVAAEVAEVLEPMRRQDFAAAADCAPGIIRADQLRFRQILRNLLSNARKYGGPEVSVEGRVKGRSYQVVVADNGGGLPKELEDRVFQRFIHQDTQTAVKDSVGLGLSIVHSLAEGMSGSVEYVPFDGRTRFVLTMPLADSFSPVNPFTELLSATGRPRS